MVSAVWRVCFQVLVVSCCLMCKLGYVPYTHKTWSQQFFHNTYLYADKYLYMYVYGCIIAILVGVWSCSSTEVASSNDIESLIALFCFSLCMCIMFCFLWPQLEEILMYAYRWDLAATSQADRWDLEATSVKKTHSHSPPLSIYILIYTHINISIYLHIYIYSKCWQHCFARTQTQIEWCL